MTQIVGLVYKINVLYNIYLMINVYTIITNIDHEI